MSFPDDIEMRKLLHFGQGSGHWEMEKEVPQELHFPSAGIELMTSLAFSASVFLEAASKQNSSESTRMPDKTPTSSSMESMVVA